jgi:hypothetical protein
LQKRGFHAFLEESQIAQAAKLTDGFLFAQMGELYVSAALEWHQ